MPDRLVQWLHQVDTEKALRETVEAMERRIDDLMMQTDADGEVPESAAVALYVAFAVFAHLFLTATGADSKRDLEDFVKYLDQLETEDWGPLGELVRAVKDQAEMVLDLGAIR